MRRVVFYSWQSDLPNATNRGFIQHALEDAAASIEADESIDLEPVVDRDTKDVPGAPEIASTIFAKIEAADVFVADVSIVSRPPDGRPCPNPNVLIELGYALHALGADRVIPVFNEAFGSLDELPFDLRARRHVVYRMAQEETDRASERRVLVKKLRAALLAAFEVCDEKNAGASEAHIEPQTRHAPSPASLNTFMEAVDSGFPKLAIHALKDVESMVYTTEIEKAADVMTRMLRLVHARNDDVTIQALKTFRVCLGITDPEQRATLRKQLHGVIVHLCFGTRSLPIRQEAMNLMAEVLEIDDLEQILHHVVHAPNELYAVTKPLYIITVLKQHGHGERVRQELYNLKQAPLSDEVEGRVDELIDHLRSR